MHSFYDRRSILTQSCHGRDKTESDKTEYGLYNHTSARKGPGPLGRDCRIAELPADTVNNPSLGSHTPVMDGDGDTSWCRGSSGGRSSSDDAPTENGPSKRQRNQSRAAQPAMSQAQLLQAEAARAQRVASQILVAARAAQRAENLARRSAVRSPQFDACLSSGDGGGVSRGRARGRGKSKRRSLEAVSHMGGDGPSETVARQGRGRPVPDRDLGASSRTRSAPERGRRYLRPPRTALCGACICRNGQEWPQMLLATRAPIAGVTEQQQCRIAPWCTPLTRLATASHGRRLPH